VFHVALYYCQRRFSQARLQQYLDNTPKIRCDYAKQVLQIGQQWRLIPLAKKRGLVVLVGAQWIAIE